MSVENDRVPISVLIATKNEAANLGRCLGALRGWADQVVVVDSNSTDNTQEIARAFGATILNFSYSGGWPKKRQWALDTFDFRNEWILLLDADEILSDEIKVEIGEVLQSPEHDGYLLRFQIVFLGRQLRFGDTELWKLFLFRQGRGRYERRLEDQDSSMGDIEVHEHVVVDGSVGRLHSPVRHENRNSLSRYIEKHNEYSNWEAKLYTQDAVGEIVPRLWGNQAERRRWLRRVFLGVPGFPFAVLAYKYFWRLGILDGVPGLIYCSLQAIQFFHIKAKVYEIEIASRLHPPPSE